MHIVPGSILVRIYYRWYIGRIDGQVTIENAYYAVDTTLNMTNTKKTNCSTGNGTSDGAKAIYKIN